MHSRSRQFPRRRSLSANLHASRDRAQAAKTPHGSAGAGGRPSCQRRLGRPLDLGAESRGRGGVRRPKACGQVALAAEAAVQSDAGNRQGCHGQQLAGLLRARGHDIAMWGLARGFLKEAAEMREACARSASISADRSSERCSWMWLSTVWRRSKCVWRSFRPLVARYILCLREDRGMSSSFPGMRRAGEAVDRSIWSLTDDWGRGRQVLLDLSDFLLHGAPARAGGALASWFDHPDDQPLPGFKGAWRFMDLAKVTSLVLQI